MLFTFRDCFLHDRKLVLCVLGGFFGFLRFRFGIFHKRNRVFLLLELLDFQIQLALLFRKCLDMIFLRFDFGKLLRAFFKLRKSRRALIFRARKPLFRRLTFCNQIHEGSGFRAFFKTQSLFFHFRRSFFKLTKFFGKDF